jgi:hypothetical protein
VRNAGGNVEPKLYPAPAHQLRAETDSETSLVRASPVCEVVSELLFVLLPLLVLFLNRFLKGDYSNVAMEPEFSFVAAVLFGQAIAKYVARALRDRPNMGQAVLAVTAIIVFGLVPALLTLSWVLNADAHAQGRASWIQLSLFLAGIIIFLQMGAGRFLSLRRRSPAQEPHASQ